MTVNRPETGKKPTNASQKTAHKKRRRRARGVPAPLVAVLLVIALFFGGFIGYVVANRTNSYSDQLARAETRVTELENMLTMMGFSEDDGSADEWVFDDSDVSDEFGDLSGQSGDGGDAFWSESGLITGAIDDSGEPVVVAEFKGGSVLSTEVIDPYNDALAMEVFNGSDAEDVSSDVLKTVLQELVAEKVLYARAEELGLTSLSDDDLAAIRESAEAYYDDQRLFYAGSVETAGMTDEQAAAAIDDYLNSEVGITLDGLIEEEKESYWMQKLYDYVSQGVTVSDEAIQSAYDDLLASQRELFTESAEEYEYATMVGDPIAYNLEGYRRIKHILLPFDSTETADQAYDLMAQIAQLDPETDMEQITQLQSQLDALYVDLDARADAILAELSAGADFDAMVEQYGADDAMMFEPTRTTGYYVSANSTQWDGDFLEGCMMLEKPGQISTPVHSVSGVHIIQYVADVTPGEVPLVDVRDAIADLLLFDLQEEAYDAQIAAWIAEADAKYYPERLQ